jgi:DNA recombination protein RmuC
MLLNLALSLLVIGMAAAGLVTWLVRSRALAAERERASRAEGAQRDLLGQLQDERVTRASAETVAARVPLLEAELSATRNALSEAMARHSHTAAEHAAAERAHGEKLAELTSLRGEIEARMQALATEALRGSQESFLALAGQAFERHKQAAAGLFEQKEQAIAALLAPIATTLEAYHRGLGGFETAWRESHAVLQSEVQNVSSQARKLANALQASPKTRGRWGEQQLQNVIELAGMSAQVDFVPQQTIDGDEGKLRPDMIIRVPGDRRIVVDAKTPLTAYLDAVETTDDELREHHLRRHAQQLRTHMRQLADKKYWEALLPLTPDYVVMFIPGENFYAAAIERDPGLFEEAIERRVLIVTPTTMIALAKAIATGWRQEKMAEHARQVGELGRELYKRLATMGDHIVQLGGGLRRAVEHYNRFVGSMETSVMPQARRFNELAVEGTHEALPDLKPIEVDTRLVRGDRDLVLEHGEIIALPKTEHPPAAE